MLLVQEYLKTHSFSDLAREHGAYASLSQSGHKFSLNYDQIEAKEADPLSQECRGLILARQDGAIIPVSAEGKRSPAPDYCPGETVIVAYPMKRFFNHGQGSAANINWSDPNLAVLEKLDGCFTYDTVLNCWDGSNIKVGKVVKDKLNPTLIGMDKSGNLVPCQVLDWFDNGTKDNWLQIETDLKCRGKRRKFLVTTNHAIFVNGNFIPAFVAKVGDELSSYEERMSDDVIHLIESSLLGDGSLSKNGPNFKYEEGHKYDHKELSEYIGMCLGECYSHTGIYTSGFGTEMIRTASKPNKDLSILRKKWYRNGVKKVPIQLDWMTDFTVAKWFMDDGSLAHNDNQQDRALFATNGFSKNEVLRLGKKLSSMYGVSCAVYLSKGWCLRVNAGRDGSIHNMWKAIAPYIVPCMKYKLPEEYRDVPFIGWQINGKLIKKTYPVKITKITSVNPSNINNRKKFPHGRKGFDIKTSTENYMANGVIVHNSLCIVYYDQFIEQWCVATRSVPEADLVMDNGLYTFRTLFERAVKDTLGWEFSEFTDFLSPAYTYCFELTTPYNRIVVDYQECRITLLALRNMNYLEERDPAQDTIAAIFPIVQAHTYSTLDELLNWVSSLNPLEHEGVVIRDSNFNRIKVKNASYVAYSKLSDRLGSSERNLMEFILLGQDDDIVSQLAPEIGQNMIKLKEGLNKAIMKYDGVYNIMMKAMKALGSTTKKDFAMMVVNHKGMWHAPFFQMFDGKVSSMKDFIIKNKKDGTWSDSFIDKLLELSKT